MIKARFVKAEPTKDGITLILKAEKSKELLRKTAELLDEDCHIGVVDEYADVIPVDDPLTIIITAIKPIIAEQLHIITKQGYEKAKAEITGLFKDEIPPKTDDITTAGETAEFATERG